MHPFGSQTVMMSIEVTSPDNTAADSESESLIVHSNGDCNIEDFLSENECETDVEIETGNDSIKPEYLNRGLSDPSFLKAEAARAQTRLLSRSHSASDLTTQPDNLSVSSLPIEPPRRNSSGEYPGLDDDPPPKPLGSNILLQDIELPKYKSSHLHRNSLSPNSGHVSTLSMPASWKNVPTVQDREDDFTMLLQTTAERVLNKLKSRQQDLRCDLGMGQKYQRRPSHGLQPPVPRKLQPILRDGNKTPRSESDMRSVNSDGDLGPLSAA